MGADLRFGKNGELIVAADKLGKLAAADPGELRLMRLVDDLLVCAQPQPGGRRQPLLYGDLRLFHMAELMALISSMRKDGVLTLYVPHARFTICFAEGEVVYASSTVEDFRLGEVLWRRGHLSLEQLGEVQDLVRPGKKLGKLLIERGLLTRRQLYDEIREQVQEIIFSTFHFDRGEFVFVEGDPGLKGTVRLDMTTRELIREGVGRVQKMMDARARTCQQRHEAGELPDVLAGYVRMLRRIHQTLKVEAPDAIGPLEDFPENPPEQYEQVFEGVSLDADGQLAVDTLYGNALRLDASRARELALGALRSLYDYAVFQAMDVLNDDACDALMERLDRDRAELAD